jgi:hypothetical protein
MARGRRKGWREGGERNDVSEEKGMERGRREDKF